SVIHGFIPAGRANHYMPSLKAGSIVKVDRFEMWLDKSVLSKALTLPKKQLESLSVSSLIYKEARPPMYKQDSVVDLTLTVRDLWFPNSKVWNAHKLFETFTEEDVLLILKIKPSQIDRDSDVWGFTKNGSKMQQGVQNSFKVFPWVLWHLWKGRNALVFEKTRLTPNSIITKALEESEIWFLVQHQVPKPTTVESSTNSLIGKWEKPPSDIVKCNVGTAWIDTCFMSGASWIVRDYQGQAIQHSQQAITGSSSKRESDLRSLLWAVQAMSDLRHKKVLFEASSIEVREALLNPLSFSDLSPLILKILELLNCFEKWAVFHVSARMNRIAKSIAESVILGPRPQSYVAAGGPC
ncbi:hypothetical protein DY000_02032737, partial [Brassica cretica]